MGATHDEEGQKEDTDPRGKCEREAEASGEPAECSV